MAKSDMIALRTIRLPGRPVKTQIQSAIGLTTVERVGKGQLVKPGEVVKADAAIINTLLAKGAIAPADSQNAQTALVAAGKTVPSGTPAQTAAPAAEVGPTKRLILSEVGETPADVRTILTSIKGIGDTTATHLIEGEGDRLVAELPEAEADEFAASLEAAGAIAWAETDGQLGD